MLEVAGEGSFLCLEQIALNPAHLGRQQVIKLGCEVKPDPLPGPLQGHATNKQHHQDEVREGGGEVHDLQETRAWDAAGPVVSAIPEVTCVQLLFMGLTFPDVQRIAGTGK